MTIDELKAKYMADSHAVQSGIAFLMGRIPYYNATTPKHLRTGIDTSKADIGAICQLLVKKGFMSEQELWEALAESMEAERRSYEKLCTETLGAAVTLA